MLSQDPIDNCLPRVRAHLRDLDAGEVPLRTTKVIVLGNGRVGKTQLCRRLRGLDYDDTVKSTHGITIASTQFGDGETLNLWDFGGQDIYHGAHALFMRTRAIFVVAWHPDYETTPNHTHEGMTFENRPLAYWLAFVQAMGAPASPVIVVQCQVEDRKQLRTPPVDLELRKALDPEIIAYSAHTQRGRGALHDAIADAIERLRQRDGLASIGAGRARVVDRLMVWRTEDEPRPAAERRHRVIETEDFAALCAEAGGVSSPAMLLDYLHHCGLVYHDPNYFSGRVLLDITWALDAIYSVFDRHTAWRHLQATHGRFKRAQLAATVWQAHGEDEQRLFLRLMRSCGICFRHGGEHRSQGDDDEYIAPDLLPDEAAVAEHLAGRWDEDTLTRILAHLIMTSSTPASSAG
ncbi:MAG: COR domain-containing protein [bacterium]